MNNDKDNLIPIQYTWVTLYSESIIDEQYGFYVSGPKKDLVFYDVDAECDENRLGQIQNIEFMDFATAYAFILKHNLKVRNIMQGSYDKEIKDYKKKYIETGQIRLF